MLGVNCAAKACYAPINPAELERMFPLLVVGALFLIALVCTRISIGKVSGTGERESTRYNRVIGVSKYEPPGIVFAIAWGIVYIGYALLWTVGNHTISDRETLDRFNWVLGIGAILNFTWSILVGLAGAGLLNAKVAHAASTAVLVLIVVHSTYAFFRVRELFSQDEGANREACEVLTFTFAIYAAWAVVASFLSFTSPYVCE